ncbi:hypothetical protein GN958_ATG17653 [Phytophthora infestans]|uniref:Uncharacterized protein n=1 Tax=Phytophthora infestans TaxID=4787 RepID=A0A8S9TWP8_PHYIN|nr:hypothetical protein GN958_ATG17653 [Phytophthora infestans]
MIKFSSGNDEGVPSDFRALRSDTVKRCYDLLPPFTVENVSPILAICAPPTLGRTAVLHPLHNSLESGHIRRIYGHNFERFCFSEYKVVELVDGAENTFDDRDFWREFVKGVLAGFRFVLFTSYGAPVTFLDWGKVVFR